MEDRGPIDEVMLLILPLLHQRLMQLFTHNDSDQSALIQKQILKIFHAYSQVTLVSALAGFSICSSSFILIFVFYQCKPWPPGWRRVVQFSNTVYPRVSTRSTTKIERNIPGGSVRNGHCTFSIERSKGSSSSSPSLVELRWAFRHGAPMNLPKQHSPEMLEFANYYLKGFSGKVIGLVFGVLEAYRQKIFVSPRVLQLSLNFLRER